MVDHAEPAVTVVIPVMNEEENIVPLVERIRRISKDWHVLFVDGGSSDGTQEIIARLSKRDTKIRMIVCDGSLHDAIITGIRSAKTEYVVVMDGDLQHPPEAIPKIVEALQAGAEIAVASRYIKDARVTGWSLRRKVISMAATIGTRLFVSAARKIHDPLSGFFGINTGRVCLPDEKNGGFKALLDIIASNPGAKITEIPYDFQSRKRGTSKVKISTGIWLVVQWVSSWIRRR